MSIHPAAARGFANAADDYERNRPSYPAEAVDFLVAGLDLRPGRTVVDVAAGTGKLTRLLVPSGARVIAVEPVAEMRRVLETTVAGVEVLDGVAEDLPLAPGSADAITVAQAFHWFDESRAYESFHRTLRPGGALAIVYNKRETTGWIGLANDIVEPYRNGAPDHRSRSDASMLFTPPEVSGFDNPQTLTPDEVVGRFRSLSFVGALEPQPQAAALGRIAELLATHPDTRGRQSVVIPQRTVVSICRKL